MFNHDNFTHDPAAGIFDPFLLENNQILALRDGLVQFYHGFFIDGLDEGYIFGVYQLVIQFYLQPEYAQNHLLVLFFVLEVLAHFFCSSFQSVPIL